MLFPHLHNLFLPFASVVRNRTLRKMTAVIWGKLACPSERVQRERHSACALNGHASFSQITADVA